MLSPDATRSATVQSLEAGETFAVFRDDFTRLQAKHPGVNRCLMALMAEQLRRVNERVVAAHYLDAETRVRWSLVELSRTYAKGQVDGEVVVPLTQEQVGDLAGAARPTVNRVLKEEEARGLIALERGAIRVVDREQLRKRIIGMPHPTRGSF
jgi:CRP-like cAMP-binding protein